LLEQVRLVVEGVDAGGGEAAAAAAAAAHSWTRRRRQSEERVKGNRRAEGSPLTAGKSAVALDRPLSLFR